MAGNYDASLPTVEVEAEVEQPPPEVKEDGVAEWIAEIPEMKHVSFVAAVAILPKNVLKEKVSV